MSLMNSKKTSVNISITAMADNGFGIDNFKMFPFFDFIDLV